MIFINELDLFPNFKVQKEIYGNFELLLFISCAIPIVRGGEIKYVHCYMEGIDNPHYESGVIEKYVIKHFLLEVEKIQKHFITSYENSKYWGYTWEECMEKSYRSFMR